MGGMPSREQGQLCDVTLMGGVSPIVICPFSCDTDVFASAKSVTVVTNAPGCTCPTLT